MMRRSQRLRAAGAQASGEDLVQILEISRQMAAKRDLMELLDLILDRAAHVVEAERASLFLVDRETHELWSKIAQDSEISEIRFPIGVGIAGSVAETGMPSNIPDAYDDPRFNKDFDLKTGFRTRAVLCVPLRDIDGDVVGVIQVLNKTGGGAFSMKDEYLLLTLAAQGGVALTQARLMETYVEAQKLQQEMNLARDIQRGLLPDDPPRLERFDIAAFCESADETGGDYYDFLPLPDDPGRCAVAIGDVSGHGLPAALVMVAARAMLRTAFHGRQGLQAVVERMNSLLTPDLDEARFMTFFLGLLESDPPRIRYTNAGHEPPIIYRPGTQSNEEGQIFQLESTGMMLGVLEEMEYPEGEPRDLYPGDVILLCTDGLFEARSEDDQIFGLERMNRCLMKYAHRGAQGIVDGIANTLGAFAGNTTQADDLTFVVIKVNPPASEV